jgi:general secretion pathway protein M
MTIRERLERLEDRERRLLGILALVIGVILLLLIPFGVTALLHGSRSDNAQLRDTIQQIHASRATAERSRAMHRALEERYSRPAPPLTAFLATLAKDVGVEIPETQDRPVVNHGKRYEEKSTKISLRRVGMLKLVRLMERIEQSGHPVSISQLNIRKRGMELDSFDVDMVVSAFERKPDKPAPVKPKAKDAAAATDGKEAP